MVNTEQPIQYYAERLAGNLEILFIAVLCFFAPIAGILITVIVFITLDTIMGIWKSVKNKVPITSRGLSALISKAFLYEVTVLATYLVDFFILNSITTKIFSQDMLVTKIIALTLLSIEIVSINENFKAVRGISIWEAMKRMVSRAQEAKDELKNTLK